MPGRREIRGDVQAVGGGERLEIDAGARDAGDVARELTLGGGGRGGRALAGDRGDVRRDRGIEGARRLVERRLQRFRIERRRVSGGSAESGRGRRVAAQRGNAGEPAQGVGHVVGGG